MSEKTEPRLEWNLGKDGKTWGAMAGAFCFSIEPVGTNFHGMVDLRGHEIIGWFGECPLLDMQLRLEEQVSDIIEHAAIDYKMTFDAGVLAGLEIARKMAEGHEALHQDRYSKFSYDTDYDAWQAVKSLCNDLNAEIARRSGT